jgi:dienelactone hydrolase
MEDVATTTSEEIQRIGNAEVDKQALDCRFVLDELARWNAQQGSQWQGRLDTDNAGAFGHSLGGAVAIECWATDPRIQAAMNLDGWTFGSQASSGRRKAFSVPAKPAPLLFVYEGNYNPFPEKEISGKSETEQQVDIWDATHVRQLLEHHGGFMFKLHGADHMNFTDRTISSPLRRLAGGGSIDPRVAHRILRDYAVQFFNQALRGLPSPLLEGRQSYVEISVPGVEMQPS